MKPAPIRVVIDTNVLVSSLWGGKPRRVIDLWDQGDILVVASEQVLNEYLSVLARFDLTEEDIDDITILFSNPSKTSIVQPKARIHVIKKDPADNKFLECAVEGEADFIVSGDKHLLELARYKSVRLVSPSEFLSSF